MSEAVVVVKPPAALPVSVSDFIGFCGFSVYTDTTLAAQQQAQMSGLIAAATNDCERWCRSAFLTRTLFARLDCFPGHSPLYERNGFAAILLSEPPFQAIEYFRYVDTTGCVQDLPLDVSYGTAYQPQMYGYQLERGAGSVPASLVPPWARPWPPVRLVPGCVMVQYRAGYGGPATVSIGSGSTKLSAPGFTFFQADAPLLTGDTGLPVRIPGAGEAGADLVTTVASVDTDGNATLADTAATAVDSVQAWIGKEIPGPILLAIKFQAQFYYEQPAIVDQPLPRVVTALLSSYRNLVS
jgi:hypothetical protein